MWPSLVCCMKENFHSIKCITYLSCYATLWGLKCWMLWKNCKVFMQNLQKSVLPHLLQSRPCMWFCFLRLIGAPLVTYRLLLAQARQAESQFFCVHIMEKEWEDSVILMIRYYKLLSTLFAGGSGRAYCPPVFQGWRHSPWKSCWCRLFSSSCGYFTTKDSRTGRTRGTSTKERSSPVQALYSTA